MLCRCRCSDAERPPVSGGVLDISKMSGIAAVTAAVVVATVATDFDRNSLACSDSDDSSSDEITLVAQLR